MSVPPVISVQSVLVAKIKNKSMFVPSTILCETQKGQRTIEQPTMLDCGARGRFINQNYAKTLGLETQELDEPILVKNVDGTFNKKGTIKQYVNLNITIHGRKK